MGFLQSMLRVVRRRDPLTRWAESIRLTDGQQRAMCELWQAARRERLPQRCPVSELMKDEREHLLWVCSSGFRPQEFGNSDSLRFEAYKRYRKMGFTTEQAAVLVGMKFNKVGRSNIKRKDL